MFFCTKLCQPSILSSFFCHLVTVNIILLSLSLRRLLWALAIFLRHKCFLHMTIIPYLFVWVSLSYLVRNDLCFTQWKTPTVLCAVPRSAHNFSQICSVYWMCNMQKKHSMPYLLFSVKMCMNWFQPFCKGTKSGCHGHTTINGKLGVM